MGLLGRRGDIALALAAAGTSTEHAFARRIKRSELCVVLFIAHGTGALGVAPAAVCTLGTALARLAAVRRQFAAVRVVNVFLCGVDPVRGSQLVDIVAFAVRVNVLGVGGTKRTGGGDGGWYLYWCGCSWGCTSPVIVVVVVAKLVGPWWASVAAIPYRNPNGGQLARTAAIG